MKITEVKLYPVHTPRETGTITQHVVAQFFTDEGIVGLGEMSDFNHDSVVPDLNDVEKCMNKTLAGLDPFDPAAVAQEAERYGGRIGASIDIAVYDIRGKALNVPVYELLGGAYRKKIPVCYPIFPVKNEAEVEANLRRVEWVLEHDFTMIRFYCGGKENLDFDEMFLSKLRETYGERVTLKSLDMSRIYELGDAIQVIERFADYGFMLVESPCADVEDKARVRSAVQLPISEHIRTTQDILEFAQKRAVDICNISVPGRGITSAARLFAVVEAVGLKSLIGTTQELSIGTAAQAHLGAAVPNLDYPCDPAGARLYQKDVVKKRVQYKEGHLIVPEGPGLGMELDEDKVKEISKPLSVYDRLE